MSSDSTAFNQQAQMPGSIGPSAGTEQQLPEQTLSVSSSEQNITPYSTFSNLNKQTAYAKPGFTYSALIVMAIRSSMKKRLPLNSICDWIAENFAYYQTNRTRWQNAIRHNLSLNPYFIRVPRALDDHGRGNYWTIDPSAEHITIGETTGRIRRNNYSMPNRAYGPVTTQRLNAAFENSNYGSFLHHPYPPSKLVPTYSGLRVSPNAIYFPTPEEMHFAQESLLQQRQFEHQQMWAYYHHQHMLQEQKQQSLLQQTPIKPWLPPPAVFANNPALGYCHLQHAMPHLSHPQLPPANGM